MADKQIVVVKKGQLTDRTRKRLLADNFIPVEVEYMDQVQVLQPTPFPLNVDEISECLIHAIAERNNTETALATFKHMSARLNAKRATMK